MIATCGQLPEFLDERLGQLETKLDDPRGDCKISLYITSANLNKMTHTVIQSSLV
jgi:hypothetical protein